MDTRREKLEALKKEKNAVIMAHYYVPDEVQEIADYIGDSYYLSDMATKVDASVIVLCGVRFMGESAKILNPGKKVLLPDLHADCPMAHMAEIEKIKEVRQLQRLQRKRARRQSFSFTRSAEVKSLHLPIMSEAPQASSNMPRQVKIPSFSLQPSLVFSRS